MIGKLSADVSTAEATADLVPPQVNETAGAAILFLGDARSDIAAIFFSTATHLGPVARTPRSIGQSQDPTASDISLPMFSCRLGALRLVLRPHALSLSSIPLIPGMV